MNFAADSNRPQHMSEAEWTARLQLAAAYRIFDHIGWAELIYNHISLRVPGPERHFLINPFGLHYSEVNASNLVKIDLLGNIVEETGWPINPAGFTPHSTIHGNIEHAHCVMHTHTTAGLAVACAEEGLSITNFYAAQLGDRVAYHDFEGITVHSSEGPRLLASIGDRNAVILRNHGLLTWGETLPAAFYTMWVMQRACEVQIAGAALGRRIAIKPHVQQLCAEDAKRFNQADMGVEAFNAMVRVIDVIDPSWRQ